MAGMRGIWDQLLVSIIRSYTRSYTRFICPFCLSPTLFLLCIPSSYFLRPVSGLFFAESKDYPQSRLGKTPRRQENTGCSAPAGQACYADPPAPLNTDKITCHAQTNGNGPRLASSCLAAPKDKLVSMSRFGERQVNMAYCHIRV